MTLTTRKLTFEEYLVYDDGFGSRFELVEGALIPMSLGSGEHGEIIRFLERQFEQAIAKLKQPWLPLAALMGVQSPRGTRWDTSRIPDVTIIPTEQWQSLRKREAVIQLNEPPPLLLVEVVSESTQAIDYGAKRIEYRLLGVAEYWIVDPLALKVTIYQLIDDIYYSAEYQGEMRLHSPTLQTLELTAAQVLAATL
jgi:Uma2 family endonuclease